MSRQPGNGGDFARGASTAVAKGTALIGLAVIVGVFLLQRVDTSTAGSQTTPVKKPTKTTTSTRPPRTTSTTTSTTQPAAPAKTPDQLKVLVLNGGAPTGDAAKLRTKLVQAGYTNEPQANTWTDHKQTGLTLMCKPGLDREKVALSQQTALQGVRVIGFPTPAPPDSDSVDCVVVLGS